MRLTLSLSAKPLHSLITFWALIVHLINFIRHRFDSSWSVLRRGIINRMRLFKQGMCCAVK